LKIIIIAVLATMLLGGGLVAATFYFVNGMQATQMDATKIAKSEDDADTEEDEEEVEEEPKGPLIYHSMDPKFVVSFRDQRTARFMQFSFEVTTRDKSVIELLDGHSPAIRSNLLMLFDNQNHADMTTREGKQQLLLNIVTEINETLEKMTNKDELKGAVEAAYFTSFVIQ
jgi:flagellar basal body-associated protein FliL